MIATRLDIAIVVTGLLITACPDVAEATTWSFQLLKRQSHPLIIMTALRSFYMASTGSTFSARVEWHLSQRHSTAVNLLTCISMQVELNECNKSA